MQGSAPRVHENCRPGRHGASREQPSQPRLDAHESHSSLAAAFGAGLDTLSLLAVCSFNHNSSCLPASQPALYHATLASQERTSAEPLDATRFNQSILFYEIRGVKWTFRTAQPEQLAFPPLYFTLDFEIQAEIWDTAAHCRRTEEHLNTVTEHDT